LLGPVNVKVRYLFSGKQRRLRDKDDGYKTHEETTNKSILRIPHIGHVDFAQTGLLVSKQILRERKTKVEKWQVTSCHWGNLRRDDIKLLPY
jgi:hypothetical protein